MCLSVTYPLSNRERILRNSRLKIGFGCVDYMLLENDMSKITCHHCGKTGHRAYRQEKMRMEVDGVEQEITQRKLICPNAS